MPVESSQIIARFSFLVDVTAGISRQEKKLLYGNEMESKNTGISNCMMFLFSLLIGFERHSTMRSWHSTKATFLLLKFETRLYGKMETFLVGTDDDFCLLIEMG